MIENYLNQATTQSDELRLARYFNDACRKSKWISDNYLVEYLGHEVKDVLWLFVAEKHKTGRREKISVSEREMNDFYYLSHAAAVAVNNWHVISGRV
jgi:hypothetical protein